MSAERPEKCWRIIGVFGDASCPDLAAHAHCRHCPRYSEAGNRLFDRAIPPEFSAEWTRVIAAAKETGLADPVSVLIFRLRGEWFALKTTCFRKAADARPIHTVPLKSGRVFLGLVNIDGELLPCMSAAEAVNLPWRRPAMARRGARAFSWWPAEASASCSRLTMRSASGRLPGHP